MRSSLLRISKQEDGAVRRDFGILRGENPGSASSAPFLIDSATDSENRKGNQMLFDADQFSMIQEVTILQEAAARTGFSMSEIQALVECELETSQVLDYISAVLSNRMN
jgi:hypothetical protein